MTTAALVETAPRVALLARPGTARERLQTALHDAGAQVVLVSDPADTDIVGIREAGAGALLIALEPAVEHALDRFDALLADPEMIVIFDEAELAAQREGWDAARWTRHLAAKLNRHLQVMPPGMEIDAALHAEPVALDLYQRPESDGDFSAFAGEADLLGLDVPRDFGLGGPAEGTHSNSASMFDPVLAELDTFTAPTPPDFGELLLEPSIEPVGDDVGTHNKFRRDLDDLHLRIADMQLEEPRPSRAPVVEGAVVVLAGIGGPDAVRQLLSELPLGFPRAVLIQQRLEGGRHDKLVRQMQRATTMPVALAEPGMAIDPGHVYMLPADMGVAAGAGGLQFQPSERPGVGEAILAQLRPADSAVVLLSGTDPATVDAAMNHSVHGALVVGQSVDGCFDPAAASALVARGAEAGTPSQLAKKLAIRWPAADSVRDFH